LSRRHSHDLQHETSGCGTADLTIRHSTRSSEEFVELLRQNDIRILVDVRSWPSSLRYPHFSRDSLARILEQNGVRYEWLGEQLGGYRKKGLGEESPNKGWRSLGFRNYADHTMTEQFREGVGKLLGLADDGRLALMCAEQLYWRHSIISDYLTVKGHTVTHIVSKGKTQQHMMTSFAKNVDGELRYS
jgi:uncharacterized protein (DUF488 family)